MPNLTNEAKLQLAEIVTNQEKLLELLSHVPSQQLQVYPDLLKHINTKSSNSLAVKNAIKDGRFTQDQWHLALFRLLDNLGYELASNLDLEFLNKRVVNLVGADIDSIDELSLTELGAEVIAELLVRMANKSYEQTTIKISNWPWRATKGRADPIIYRKLQDIWDNAWAQGLQSHYKLDLFCQDKYDRRCPQSLPKLFREHGEPNSIKDWGDWVKN